MRQLEGTVVTNENKPIEGCSVTLEAGTNGGLRQTRSTDAAGQFAFGSVMTLGGCFINIEKPEYMKRRVECPTDGKPLRVVLELDNTRNR
jgi:hypothetical protein